ncbi:MAG: hypothetical protein DME59_14750 [Verrucomicrobia bacterium]|nr:MAG: hypothetical protein DME59_14750 [Verrucomicrobiota bacterium]
MSRSVLGGALRVKSPQKKRLDANTVDRASTKICDQAPCFASIAEFFRNRLEKSATLIIRFCG